MFILNCGPDGNIIRFIPPLNVSQDDLDRGIDILSDAIEAYETGT
jgi:4-aminobutyrate aminotransferase-like enzyme